MCHAKIKRTGNPKGQWKAFKLTTFLLGLLRYRIQQYAVLRNITDGVVFLLAKLNTEKVGWLRKIAKKNPFARKYLPNSI